MTPFTLNIRGNLCRYDRPLVMGILNVTPDSFHSASRAMTPDLIADRVQQMADQGADIIDIGGYSSRPGADDVTPQVELQRLALGLSITRRTIPDIPLSVDTFRADVARRAVLEHGADIINDISGGTLDADMPRTVAGLRVPYILMHTRGTPATMQGLTDYSAYGGNVATGVVRELLPALTRFAQLGVNDIIVDPGFGFAKTTEQNFALMRDLRLLDTLGRPVLVGISRKSMIFRTLGTDPAHSLNGTTALNTMALERGAAILRVHDVQAAREAVTLYTATISN